MMILVFIVALIVSRCGLLLSGVVWGWMLEIFLERRREDIFQHVRMMMCVVTKNCVNAL